MWMTRVRKGTRELGVGGKSSSGGGGGSSSSSGGERNRVVRLERRVRWVRGGEREQSRRQAETEHEDQLKGTRETTMDLNTTEREDKPAKATRKTRGIAQ